MLTVSEAEDDLFAALRAGARGYLLKDMDPRRLPEALHDVWTGAVAYPRPLVARMVEEFRDTTPRRRQLLARDGFGSRLTSREWQVLDLLARKKHTTAEIADQLVLTPSAVRAHIASVVKKLEVADRDEAIALFATRPDN
jgi:DNA-binding NarL/FixJ family response regulator